MATLAEAKSELGHVQSLQKQHDQECSCRHAVKGKRPPCAERNRLAGEAKQWREAIKHWLDMPADAVGLF